MTIELLIPDRLELEQVAAAISSSGLVSEDAGSDARRRTYYDTFDGRLRANGGPAIYEDGRLVLNGASEALERPPERMLANDLGAGPLRDALTPLIDVRALLPLAEVQIKERHLRILNSERKTVVRASIEVPALGSSGAGLRSRLRLVALRGYDRELRRVRAALERQLGLEVSPLTLVDEAVVALGGKPGGVSSKVTIELYFDQRADAAAVSVLRRLLEVIEQNLEGTIADLDPEFLHDMRVAVRRSRSVQRQLRGLFPPEELERARSEFRWVQSITGESRDLDVYLLEFEEVRALVSQSMRADLEPLRQVLQARRAAARERMVADLQSEHFTAIRNSWSALLDRLPSLPEHDRPEAGGAIGPLIGRRIANVYGRMVKEGETIDELGPSEPFHELRKRGKELRYLLELFGFSLYPSEIVRPMIRTLKGLQDMLGRHQDREVQIATLSSLAVELAHDQDALLATGALIARLDDDKSAARRDLAGRFAQFAGRDQQTLVKDTFG